MFLLCTVTDNNSTQGEEYRTTMEYESNRTNYNYKEELLGSDSWKKFDIAWLAGTSVATFCILIGNFITLLVMVNNRKLRCRNNALVGSLAVSDLCVGINHVAYVACYMNNPTKKWNVGFILFITNLSVSLLHIIFIGLERFIAIVKPLHFRSLVSNKVTLGMIIICWLIPITTLLPVYVVVMEYPQIDNGLYAGDRIHFIVIIVSYIIVFIALNLFYAVIYFIAKDVSRKMQQVRLEFSKRDSASMTSDTQSNPASTRSSVTQQNRPWKGYQLALAIAATYLSLCLPITIHASLMVY